jgi:hypothetical protein
MDRPWKWDGFNQGDIPNSLDSMLNFINSKNITEFKVLIESNSPYNKGFVYLVYRDSEKAK